MPWNVTEPEVKRFAEVLIESFQFDRLQTEAPRLFVSYVIGETVDGAFVEHSRGNARIEGVELMTKMATAVPNGLSYYDAVGSALYELLASTGKIPGGVLT